jgi:uncharacterized membrane protein
MVNEMLFSSIGNPDLFVHFIQNQAYAQLFNVTTVGTKTKCPESTNRNQGDGSYSCYTIQIPFHNVFARWSTFFLLCLIIPNCFNSARPR